MGDPVKRAFENVLRAEGFTKKGDTWHCACPQAILVANLQKSEYGPSYYVNLAAGRREDGDIYSGTDRSLAPSQATAEDDVTTHAQDEETIDAKDHSTDTIAVTGTLADGTTVNSTEVLGSKVNGGVQGVGFDSAVAAYKAAMTKVPAVGLGDSPSPLEFFVGLGAARLFKLGVGASAAANATRGAGALAFKTGAEGEAHLAKMFPGGASQVKFATEVGKGATRFRYVDWLVNKIARESKVGFTSLTDPVRKQIAKDAWLLKNGKVDGATWHFFRSAETGQVGAAVELLQELEKNGIKYVIHN